MRSSRFARYYTPVVCLLILTLLSLCLPEIVFDPSTAAQGRRIEFQSSESVTQANDLSLDEVQLAQAVLSSGFDDGRDATRILYVGNSQSMAIMDRLPGDLTSPQWLQVLLARQVGTKESQVVVRLGSLPNLTMTELVVKLVAGESPPRGIDVVLLGLVLEEWRALGVRDETLFLAQQQTVRDELTRLVAANADLLSADKSLASILQPASGSQVAAAGSQEPHMVSVATSFENQLQTWAERYIPLFAARSKLHGQISLAYYGLRNRVFGFTSATARPVPEATYRPSLELLELCLRYTQSKDIHIIFYLAPIRPIQPNPNPPADVARFRRDVPALCQRYGITCLDYTDLIPAELWTNYPDDAVGTEGQRDFAHFTGAAHKRLAEQLIVDVGALFVQWARNDGARQP